MGPWLIEQYDMHQYTGDELLSPVDFNIGGRMTTEEIDRLKELPQLKVIRILGLRQDTFAYFVSRYGHQFEVISFWKCPLVEDLSLLSGLPNLKVVDFFWNQRAEKLWDMSGNHALKGVSLNDFSRLHRLDDLATAPFLEELHFGDCVWDGLILENLAPLGQCANLRYLHFSAKKILDNDPSSLAALPRLEELTFYHNLFTTEQIAWLTARMPQVKSDVLAPIFTTRPIQWETPKGKKMNKDTVICGKKKPYLDSQVDRPRIEKYVQGFQALVEHYRKNPSESCPVA